MRIPTSDFTVSRNFLKEEEHGTGLCFSFQLLCQFLTAEEWVAIAARLIVKQLYNLQRWFEVKE